MAQYDRQRIEEDRGLAWTLSRAWHFLVFLFWMVLTGVMLWNAPFLPWIGILKLAGLMIGLAVLRGATSVSVAPPRAQRRDPEAGDRGVTAGRRGEVRPDGIRDFTAALLVWPGRANPRSRRFASRRFQARLRGAFRQNECENESLSLGAG
jgi:hypothetical protein